MIDDRIAARRREVRDQRRRGRLRRTVFGLAVLVIALMLVVVERSALVGLEEVAVEGTERLTEQEIRDAADLPLGTSTLRLRLGAVTERVTDLALVREASARRLDPLTVVIEVTERQPVLVAEGAGQQVLVDRDGVVIATDHLDGLPVVELPSRPPDPGATVQDMPALANAHAAWRGLSGPLRVEVRRYEAAGPDELELRLADGTEVRFGRAERVAEKVRALGAVLEDSRTTSITRIDVRAPGAPAVVE